MNRLLRNNSSVHKIKYYLKRYVFKNNLCICPACEAEFWSFLPLPKEFLKLVKDNNYKFELDDAETLNYRNYLCPACHSTDRDRLMIVYLKKYFKDEGSILHVAPSASISHFVQSKTRMKETTVDLFMKDVDHNISLTDLSIFKDETFDHVICSHVLEHIEDDHAAAKELFRVLKKGTVSIFLVPINKKLVTTLKVEGDDDVAVRWHYYGQDDHVRFYSRKGFLELLEQSGFDIEVFNPTTINLSLVKPLKKLGIANNSILYIARKN